MTKVLASEFAPFGILVNALCPGFVLTDQWARNHHRDAPDLTFEDYIANRSRQIPLGRLGRPEEFANAACFLASEQASFITGVALNVDGGQSPAT
jgi:NAD(P)-dependent dehydrogenase (short-subunit alcohol dehydrogenase family)